MATDCTVRGEHLSSLIFAALLLLNASPSLARESALDKIHGGISVLGGIPLDGEELSFVYAFRPHLLFASAESVNLDELLLQPGIYGFWENQLLPGENSLSLGIELASGRRNHSDDNTTYSTLAFGFYHGSDEQRGLELQLFGGIRSLETHMTVPLGIRGIVRLKTHGEGPRFTGLLLAELPLHLPLLVWAMLDGYANAIGAGH